MKFGITDDERAAASGKLAVRHLVHYSSSPALALQNEFSATRDERPFRSRAVYETIAAAEGLLLDVVVLPVGEGFEHVLFLSRVRGLTDSELTACRHPDTFNRHTPKSSRGPL